MFENLLGGLHVKSAMAELSRSDGGDDNDTVKLSELFNGRHFKGTYRSASIHILCFIYVSF